MEQTIEGLVDGFTNMGVIKACRTRTEVKKIVRSILLLRNGNADRRKINKAANEIGLKVCEKLGL